MPSVLDKPILTVFAGPNGSGKSTAYQRFLDAGLDSGEYLNPDDIAAAMRSDNAGSQAIDLRATMGLPSTGMLKSREEALADLRETERLSAELQVRDARSGRTFGAPIDRGTTQHSVLRRAG